MTDIFHKIQQKRQKAKITADKIYNLPANDLKVIANKLKLKTNFNKESLFSKILEHSITKQGYLFCEGVLDLTNGYGIIRPLYDNSNIKKDIYVSPQQIKQYKLRKGDLILGIYQPNGKKLPPLVYIEAINYKPFPIERDTYFEDLTPLYPNDRFILETSKDNISMRVMDLLTPIGKGQRGLIVAPPRTGKTTLLQQIANSITTNHPDVKLIVLLIDERPEEVTDMKRTIKGDVVSSTFDEEPKKHIHTAELVIENAKHLANSGIDVVILLDSITRLARAYNTLQPTSGKTLSGGLDAHALHKPKYFFGTARNTEEKGSLTIIATCLIDTGSRMDDIIFEEFKGTGNLEIQLDRKLADKRIFPAINIEKSGTRKEELLYHPDELQKVWKLRKILSSLKPTEAMEILIEKLNKTQSNAEFLLSLK